MRGWRRAGGRERTSRVASPFSVPCLVGSRACPPGCPVVQSAIRTAPAGEGRSVLPSPDGPRRLPATARPDVPGPDAPEHARPPGYLARRLPRARAPVYSVRLLGDPSASWRWPCRVPSAAARPPGTGTAPRPLRVAAVPGGGSERAARDRPAKLLPSAPPCAEPTPQPAVGDGTETHHSPWTLSSSIPLRRYTS